MTTETTIQQVQYPQQIQESQEKLLNSLFGVTDPDTGVYTPGLIDQQTKVPEQKVQGFTAPQEAAFNLAQQGIGGFQPYLQSGLGQQFGAAGTLGQGVQALSGMDFDPSNIDQFRDPYQKYVTDEALKEIDRQSQMASNQLAGKAVQAGAFGGSRFGLQQSELARNTADLRSRRIFEDMSRNFQQAQAAKNAANQAAAAQLPFNTASFASNILAQQAPFGGTQQQTISPFAQTNPYAQAFGAVGSLTNPGQGGLASLI